MPLRNLEIKGRLKKDPSLRLLLHIHEPQFLTWIKFGREIPGSCRPSADFGIERSD